MQFITDSDDYFTWWGHVGDPRAPIEILMEAAEFSFKNGYNGLGDKITKHPNTPLYLKRYLQAKSYLDQYGLS